MSIDKKKLGEDQLGSFELGVSTYQGSLAATGSADVTASGTNVTVRSVNLFGSSALNATGTTVSLGTATISGTTTLSTKGTAVTVGTSTLFGSGDIVSTGTNVDVGIVNLDGIADVVPEGTQVVIPSAIETKLGAETLGSFTLGDTDEVSKPISMDGSAEIYSSGTNVNVGKTTVNGSGNVVATGTNVDVGTVTLAGSNDIQVAGTNIDVGTVDFDGTANVVPEGTQVVIPNATETKLGGETLGEFTLGDTDQVSQPISIGGSANIDTTGTTVTVDSVRIVGSGTLTPEILRVKSVYTVLGRFDIGYSANAEFDKTTEIEGHTE